MKKLFLAVVVVSFLGIATQSKADTTYTVTGFTEKGGKCVATFKVSVSGKGTVTKTKFTGKAGSKKPSNVVFKIPEIPADDTTPSGKDGNWSGASNAFNGTSFRNGTWTIAITKPAGATCKDYDGTKVTIEHN